MAIDPTLLAYLVCPASHQPLQEATDDALAAVNARILAGQVSTVGGTTVEKPVSGGLLREDGLVLYPIIDEIPTLLVEEGIVLGPVA